MAVTIIKDGKATHSYEDVNQYDGEKTGGELQHWKLFGTDPSAFVRDSYGILASRCATLYHTSSIARACVNKPLTYAIGKGLFFKSQPNFKYLGLSEEEAKEWGKQFSTLLHYEKKAVKWYKKQKQLAREAKITGDAVMYFLREGSKLGIPFDIVVTQGSAIDWEKNDTGYTLGIKHDIYGRRAGFFSATSKKDVPFTDENGNQVAIQFLFPDRAGQLRGFGVYMSEIARSKNLDRIWDAILERMIQEATQVGYFNASTTDVNAQVKAMAKQAAGKTSNSADSLEMKELSKRGTPTKVGGMYVLENEESMNFQPMVTPSNNFATANEWMVNFFSMATNIPPEVIIGKYSTSYTAHKGAFNDFLKVVDEDRQDFIDGVESIVNFEYLKHFVRTKQIKVRKDFWTDYKVQMAYLEGIFLGPVPGHINPLQEVTADEKAVRAGFNLQSNVAAKYGIDFWNSIETWAEEQTAWFEKSPEKRAEQLFEAEKAASEDEDKSEDDKSDDSADKEDTNEKKPRARRRTQENDE